MAAADVINRPVSQTPGLLHWDAVLPLLPPDGALIGGPPRPAKTTPDTPCQTQTPDTIQGEAEEVVEEGLDTQVITTGTSFVQIKQHLSHF